MQEQITIRLYEDASVPTGREGGRYEPDDMKGWAVETGESVPLTDEGGGRVFGVVNQVQPQAHEDDQGRRYRIATVWIQD